MSEPALWRVGDYCNLDNFPYMVCRDDGPAVAKVMFATDARLIAAAPELLAALGELRNSVLALASGKGLECDAWIGIYERLARARLVIERAEGAPVDGCMWCRYGDHPAGAVCPTHQAGREPTDADYWDAIYDRGQR